MSSCEACADETALIDPELEACFKVLVCYNCKDSSSSLYSVITKTQAKNEFLLTDEELGDSLLLPSISRKNPHNPRWSDMKLYLRKQCRDFAIRKFGSEVQLKAAIDGRVENKTDRKSKQFLKKLKGTSRHFIAHLFIFIFAELRSKTRVEKVVQLSGAGKSHAHVFRAGKCTVCGMQVQQEEL
jgi:DNA-repair protein complementing XP-A cells